MVDGIKGAAGTGPAAVWADGAPRVSIRRRDQQQRPKPLLPGGYGTAPTGRGPSQSAWDGEPDVVMSRAAAILGGGDLNSILRRAGQAIRQLSETLLSVDPAATTDLVDTFEEEALEWVRLAVQDSQAIHTADDPLPIGLSFEDVRVTVDAGHGGLAIEVGAVEFCEEFDFRAQGVVFDIRASGVVAKPSPGFFVDMGSSGRGADITGAIIDKVRADLPSFGISTDTEGVSVLIRAEASDFNPDRDGGWLLDIDVHVPFDPSWQG